MVLIKCVAFITLIGVAFGAGTWNYVDQNKWDGVCNDADSKSQSPIDIKDTKDKKFDDLDIDRSSGKSEGKMTNNGHTIQFNPKTESILTEGGPLSDKYKMAQFHLHWGKKDGVGSEHTVKGKQYDLELHAVHYNNKFTDLGAAVASNESDALAVIGVFFESKSGATDTPLMAELKTKVPLTAGSAHDIPVTFNNILDVVPTECKTKFYHYQGGLTTPTCNEIVQWIVCRGVQPITPETLTEIRKTNLPTENAEGNYRNVQQVNDRTVYKSSVGGKVMVSVISLIISICLF